jgi:hypothetical protein
MGEGGDPRTKFKKGKLLCWMFPTSISFNQTTQRERREDWLARIERREGRVREQGGRAHEIHLVRIST